MRKDFQEAQKTTFYSKAGVAVAAVLAAVLFLFFIFSDMRGEFLRVFIRK